MVAPGAAAREAALEILRATRAGQLFDAARDRAVMGLADRDRRLAQEIAAGVLRNRRTLDGRLRDVVAGRWRTTPADLRDVLRIGLFQLTGLSRVPPHAAVGTSVELAKARHGQRSGAFVNAVLRRTLRAPASPARAELRTTIQVLAADSSHPDWLVARWHRHFGPEGTQRLLEHHRQRPPLWLQPLRWSAEAIAVAAQDAGFRVEQRPGFSGVMVQARHMRDVPGFSDGAFVVQGPAQSHLIEQAALPEGGRVWDACAAPGGKTAVLARRCRVIASDRTAVRLGRLRDTVRRTAAAVPLFLADARQPPLSAGAVDVVWLDAPCSASGTIAQHPDARWRLTPQRLARLASLQAALLDGTQAVVSSGGMLVYTTCSLEPEENAIQVDRFLDRHARFRRERPDVFVFPPDSGADGGYLAVLRAA